MSANTQLAGTSLRSAADERKTDEALGASALTPSVGKKRSGAVEAEAAVKPGQTSPQETEPAQLDPERLLTVKELAGRLQYSADWVREQVNLGRIPAVRFNSRTWRFHWATVLKALQDLR